MKLKKILALTLAVLIASVNVYAIEVTTLQNVKNAVDDSNVGRDHIDIVVRYYPDDRQEATGFRAEFAEEGASAGAVVIWATHNNAVLGADVTMTTATGCPMVAGIVVNDIASGDYGKIRVYGYYDDALVADSSHPITVGDFLATTAYAGNGVTKPGTLGGDKSSADSGLLASGNAAALSLHSGGGTDGEAMQVFIRLM